MRRIPTAFRSVHFAYRPRGGGVVAMPLKEYQRKRKFEKTPEPTGHEETRSRRGGEAQAEGRFVVQKHAARRLHYDLRLEIDGTLKCWAVPKGPTLDPTEKRLAVMTEDHPLKYLYFEAVIPEGNYGAGTMIVWDTGLYRLEDGLPAGQQVERGELKFSLEGQKLRGSFVLVRLKPKKGSKGNDWLLIKHRDEFATPDWDVEAYPESAVTGRTLEEVRQDLPPGQASEAASPADLEGAVAAKLPAKARPMLATLLEKPFSREDWLFELKWDGMRALAWVDRGRLRIESRAGRDATSQYPELGSLPRCIRAEQAILDGELVVLDEQGRSDFERMQSRMNVAQPSPAQVTTAPVTFYLFDVLYCDGYDLRGAPLIERKRLLKKILDPKPPLRYSDHVPAQGEELFELAREHGAEGIIGKQMYSSYAEGRSTNWVKLKINREVDAVIGGYTAPRGGRSHLGAILVGLYDDTKRLKYIGGVGTGFDERILNDLAAEMKPLETRVCPFSEDPQTKEAATWIKPELVARIKFREFTREHHLRQPVFLALRRDIDAAECRLAGEIPAPNSVAVTAAVASHPVLSTRQALEAELAKGKADNVLIEIDGKAQRLSNLNKVYFPEAGFTKRDLLAHYYRVAEFLLPLLKDRPLVLNRFPNGIHGKSFYQKEAADETPAWMETVGIRSEERKRDIRYLMANDLSGLLYVANLGCIEQHPWSSRFDELERPDYVFFDLDPTEDTEYSTVVDVAGRVLEVLDAIGLQVFLKTSGASGLHMYLPLERDYVYEQVRTFAEIVARLIAAELTDRVTLERLTGKRGSGLIYIDYSQNAYGKPLASPYCVRPNPDAGVSAPIARNELVCSLKPSRFTIATMPERLKKVGDLWSGFFESRQRIEPALERFRQQFQG
jgi:bifunctional non-homologous end joining protein LigD